MPDRSEALKAIDELEDQDVAEIARRIIHDPRVRQGEGFRGWWQRWVGTFAFAFVVLVAGLGLLYVQSIAEQNTKALCTFRASVQERIEQTTTFLEHPKDFPQFNDPDVIALIQAQVEGQQRTVDALSNLACD